MFRVFRSHVRTTFLTMLTKILTFTRWDGRLKGADDHRPASGWKEQESESGIIGDGRVWTEGAGCETGICTEL